MKNTLLRMVLGKHGLLCASAARRSVWINERSTGCFLCGRNTRELRVAVICYDSRAPVQQSFKAQSKPCPFVSAPVFVSAQGGYKNRKVCISQSGRIRQCLLQMTDELGGHLHTSCFARLIRRRSGSETEKSLERRILDLIIS